MISYFSKSDHLSATWLSHNSEYTNFAVEGKLQSSKFERQIHCSKERKKERKNNKKERKKERKKEANKEPKKENNKGKVKIVGFVLDNHDHFLVAMFGGNVLINMTNRKEKRWSSILSKNQYR